MNIIQVLLKQDTLGAVIRGHIIIEEKLNSIIELNFQKQKKSVKLINNLGLDYFQTITFAELCGMNPKYSSPLKILGTIRNKFAHKINTELSLSLVKSFYETFTGDEKIELQKIYSDMRKSSTKKLPKYITRNEPKYFFSLLVIALDTILEVELIRLQNNIPLKQPSQTP